MSRWQTVGFGQVDADGAVAFCDCAPHEDGRGLIYRCPECGTVWLRGRRWPKRLLLLLNRRAR
jgi:hypothetical protein